MFVLAETIFLQCNITKSKKKQNKNEKRCKKKHADIKSAVMNTKKERKNKAVSYKELVKKK
jgi:hypothetical protein